MTDHIGKDCHRSTPKKKARKGRAPLSCIEGSYCSVSKSNIRPDGTKIEISKTLALVPCRCKSQWCPDCRISHMVEWREKLRPAVAAWDKVTMITLTIDRSRFEGPVEAYKHIQAKRSVHEFVKKLHRRGMLDTAEFFYAIEFHPSSPDWVHWHVAVRGTCTDIVEKWELDQNRFLGQHWLADLWKHGLVCVSTPPSQEVMTDDGELYRVQFDDPEYVAGGEHAMHYLTKYIGKQEVEAPDWVLDADFRFRKFSTSRGLCEPVKSRKVAKQPRKKKQVKRTAREIKNSCADECKLLEVVKTETLYMGGRDTVKRFRFKATVPVAWRAIDLASKMGIVNGTRIPPTKGAKGFTRSDLTRIAERGLQAFNYKLVSIAAKIGVDIKASMEIAREQEKGKARGKYLRTERLERVSRRDPRICPG